MPQRVVDRLETIQVDKQYRERRRLALTAADRACELFDKQAAIRQACQLIVLCEPLQRVCFPGGVGNIAERNDAADQFAFAVVKSLSIDREYRVDLFGDSIQGDLVRKLLAVTRTDQWQVCGVTIVVAIFVDAAERLFPTGVGLHARAQRQNRARGWIDIHYMAVFVDDDHTIVDVPENCQHRDIGVRQSLLQAMALHGVRERCLLAFDANVIDTYIGLCASTYRRNAAMFAIPGRQCNDGVFVE